MTRLSLLSMKPAAKGSQSAREAKMTSPAKMAPPRMIQKTKTLATRAILALATVLTEQYLWRQ